MVVCSLTVSAQNKTAASQVSQRADKIINSNWTFNYFPSISAEKGYESPSYDDSKWIAVSIPHTWQIYETTRELNRGINNSSDAYWSEGWGWYRKHFSINQTYEGRKVFIEFEGVQKYCKIWVNGIYVGDHNGGYGSFDFDITQQVKKSGDNLIAVAVNNKRKDKSDTQQGTSGNYYLYGGIYRNVTIALRNKVYIPMQGSSSHEGATFITTPELSAKSGLVRIQTWVKNDNPQTRNCVLQTSIFDAANKLVQQVRSSADIKPNQVHRFDQTTKPVKNPHLWSPADPYLYKVVFEVSDGNTISDTYEHLFGFRWFRWEPAENILYVNGKKTPLIVRGSIKYSLRGDVIPPWLSEMQYDGISGKQVYNIMRVDACSNVRSIYALADKNGIIIDETIPDLADSPEFQEQQTKAIIARSRNNPSVMFRSINKSADKALLSKLIMSLDSTRILTDDGFISANTFNEVPAQSPMAGEPAKLVLKASHNKISADRGSIVVLDAGIVDSKGVPAGVEGKFLKWSVSGPAVLIGPAMYGRGFLQTDIPAANVIRSTGEPGNIRVTVSATGLASGSVLISSEAVSADNSIIAETVLKNEGRTGLDRMVLQSSRLEEIPREIKLSEQPIKLTATGKDGYRKAIREQIINNNPSLDTTTTEFRVLADLFAAYLSNNSGHMIVDDYNFNVDNFNTCRLILGYINATKLPPAFKEGLRVYYSNSVIRDGIEKNAGDEMNWLNWIPSGGTVVYYVPEAKTSMVKGTLTTSRSELRDLISLVHPGFEKFSYDARERALVFISKMNPYIRTEEKSEIVDGKNVTTIQLLAEQGQPVLIPLFKFIAE